MVSRETAAHGSAVCLALVIGFVAASFDVGEGTGPAGIGITLLSYGLFLGGGHLYLAIRGDDGMVPSDARWRYLAMLGALLGGGGIVMYAGDRAVGPVRLETVWIPVFVLIVGGYLLTETIAAYRDSRAER